MSRVLALDIGTVRTGAAISDPTRTIAQGLGVWNSDTWRNDLAECLKNYQPDVVVLGLPVRTDGKLSEPAERIRIIASELQADYPELKIATQDERFTTVIAQKAMLEADVSRRKRRENIDKIAAVVILEDWLESHR